jgi:hypothetical protein
MNMPDGSSPNPAQHFAHYDRAATTQDRPRPSLPHQSVDKLVKLRISHAPESSNFAA